MILINSYFFEIQLLNCFMGLVILVLSEFLITHSEFLELSLSISVNLAT